jgi:predicted nuclease with TOPRIM domain
MDETEASHEGEAAGCGEHLTVAERIDELEDRITELEESGDASPEELQALRKELLSLTNMEGHDQATTERLGKLEERLDELTMQA